MRIEYYIYIQRENVLGISSAVYIWMEKMQDVKSQKHFPAGCNSYD